jgi:hypothetical protein
MSSGQKSSAQVFGLMQPLEVVLLVIVMHEVGVIRVFVVRDEVGTIRVCVDMAKL